MTEASHIGELMTRMAISHPEVSFQFINNGQTKLHSSGNGNLMDVIYHIFGREIAGNLIPVDYKDEGIRIYGYLGKPVISRGNRSFEHYYVNGRYIRNSILSRAIEDAYKDFTMQHKYPFVTLLIEMNGEDVDVNVHPAKLEVRFQKQQEVYDLLFRVIRRALHEEELIPRVELTEEKAVPSAPAPVAQACSKEPEPEFLPSDNGTEKKTPVEPSPATSPVPPKEERDLNYFMSRMRERVQAYHDRNASAEIPAKGQIFRPEVQKDRVKEAVAGTHRQMDLFEDKLLDRQIRSEYRLIGQVFETYWMVEYRDNLYIIDQHAAHERVLYEKTLREMKKREFTSQYISPPIILNLNMHEAQMLRQYMDQFTRIGFEFEEFGQDSYAVRAVPANLFGIAKKDLLVQMLDGLSDELSRNLSPEIIDEKIASMSCKAAVKGNMRLSASEVDALIGELLTLDNPYHCPHGRPTIIAMTKRELEKKFKRIV